LTANKHARVACIMLMYTYFYVYVYLYFDIPPYVSSSMYMHATIRVIDIYKHRYNRGRHTCTLNLKFICIWCVYVFQMWVHTSMEIYNANVWIHLIPESADFAADSHTFISRKVARHAEITYFRGHILHVWYDVFRCVWHDWFILDVTVCVCFSQSPAPCRNHPLLPSWTLYVM